jgi:hypothetical protein
LLTRTFTQHSCSGNTPVGRGLTLVAIIPAILLTLTLSTSAMALDCLAYKPEGARGNWHADVVAGKICWFGPNWRSFLPKPKVRAENSSASKNEGGVPTDIPPRAADPAPSPVKATEAERPQDSHGLRQATPIEAEAFINAISSEWDPGPPDIPDPPRSTVERHDVIETILLFIFSTLAIGGVAFATIIGKRRARRAEQRLGFSAGAERQPPESSPVSIPVAPSLQPCAVEGPQPVTVPSWLVRVRTDS